MTLFSWEPPAFVPPEPWEAFVAMRRKKGSRAPWTDGARDVAVRKLGDMHAAGHDIAAVLWTCVEHGWSGVEWGLTEIQRGQQRLAASARQQHQPSPRGMALAAAEGLKHGR